MTSFEKPQSVRQLLDLACPYLYRREGRYTLRVRPKGSKSTCSISLKTTHRQTALAIAAHLLSTFRAFHLDRPELTWPDLKVNLQDIAEGVLKTRSVWDQIGSSGRIYADIRSDLNEIARTEPLNVDQARTVNFGRRIMAAAEARTLEGDLEPIIGIIEELGREVITPFPNSLPLSASESSPVAITTQSVTFESLSASYMEERKEDVQASTMRSMKTCCETLSAALGDLDMRTHTRADLVAVREKLKEGRKPRTVNKIITQLTTVLTWATDNGHIPQAFAKRLQIQKGAESGRIPFSQDQVVALMTHANSLPVDSWHRWALSLGVITGARIGEIQQLTTEDFSEVDGVWVMDINVNDDKTIKNKFSVRKVPLVEAHGMDLEAFKGFVERADGRLFTHTAPAFTGALNQRIREVLKIETKAGLSFHSLRHHLAGAMKAAEVPLGTAQEILGHSSGSITFDLYGSGRAVQVHRMAEALIRAFQCS
jgi:integrase